MKYTEEMIKKAGTAASKEELLEMAKAEGIEMTEAEAETAFEFLHSDAAELSDDQLEAVAGGKGGKKQTDPRYGKGTKVSVDFGTTSNILYGLVTRATYFHKQEGWIYEIAVFAMEKYYRKPSTFEKYSGSMHYPLENLGAYPHVHILSKFPPEVEKLL